MPRAFLVVMDSVGAGGAPDADRFFNGDLPDTGANTLGHIAEACAAGAAEEGRSGPLRMPNLDRLGLGAAVRLASGARMEGFDAKPEGIWGAAEEISPGKDTPSGHWELAGLPVPFEWTYFPDTQPAFPADLTAEIARLAGTDGVLGDCHASGTEIIARLGAEHEATGRPIAYTSADSVVQIAAHEQGFGLDRLLKLCEDLAPMVHAMRVGRVIARPFVGSAGDYTRTANRRDYALEPPADTLCDVAVAAGRKVHAVGKIRDIFAGRGISDVVKGEDAALMEALIGLTETAGDGSLTFANFVEFDSLYGHRRNVSGYARALEWFDSCLPRLMAGLRPDDLVLFTADHGNDPTWPGTDHTRERVPVVGSGPYSGQIGLVGFADVAASVAAHLGIGPVGPGRTFL
ncbi:phosphopentomutase [Rhodobacterales bacterium HKCCE2091]|nr:phosphopentomutase [Rhodobacterales bacterium HKCCE2091]